MAVQHLRLAVDGREDDFLSRLIAYSENDARTARDNSGDSPHIGSIAVVGLGYVGLPTALAICKSVSQTIGVDVDPERLRKIREGDVDLPDYERDLLRDSLAEGGFELTGDGEAVAGADAVIICVPTPVDGHLTPDLRPLRNACSVVASSARPGQTIIVTSTSFVGTTRDLLVRPLRERGLDPGVDVHVAFSPERIDPGNERHVQRLTPRVVGGVSAASAERAARVVKLLTDQVYVVSSPEAAEMTKLYENIFRAVTLALANECADVARVLGLDPVEVTLAAATKPYGFLATFPGPGVGGHCIPCDPHYLLWQLRRLHRGAPLIEQAMSTIAARPGRVVERVAEVLSGAGQGLAGARILVVGAAYKAGVRDLRESPAMQIIPGLRARGADVHYYDPLVPAVPLPEGTPLTSAEDPGADTWDLVLLHTVHPGFDYEWITRCECVLDATYQFDAAPHRQLV